MMRTVFHALVSHWRRAPLQLFTLLAGLALATGLWAGVQAINAEARASYSAAAATLGEGQFDQLVRRDGQPIPLAQYVALRRAGWQVSPVVEGRLNGVRLVGIEPLSAPGDFSTLPRDGFVNADAQGVYGQAATLAKLEAEGLDLIESPSVAPNTAVMDIGLALRLLGEGSGISRLLVGEQQLRGLPDLAGVAPDLVLRSVDGGSDLTRLTDSFHLNLTAFGFLAFAVGVFIVHGAIGLAFEQRRSLVRTLRALGVPFRPLLVAMAAELAVLALVGGLLGVVIGYFVAAALLPDVAATLLGLYGADVSSSLQLRPSWWGAGLGIAFVGTGLGGAGALWQLSRLPLLAAAHPRAWAMSAGRTRQLQAVLSICLLTLAGALALWGGGLLAGFALIGAVFFGAALALPLVLAGLLRLAAGLARRPVAEWFWADSRQQLRGLSLALMALLLALATNVGVSTMVSSFRLTFSGFLDQRLSSEVYVTIDTAPEVADFLTFVTPRVEAVLPIRYVDISVNGLPSELFGARDNRTYRENWRFLSAIADPWSSVQASEGALINEQLSRRGGLGLGDRIAVAGLDLPVVGIYGDYGNPVGQVVISEAAWVAAFPGITTLRYGLRLEPDDVPALTEKLIDEHGLSPSAIVNQAQVKAFSMRVFERTFVVTAALNVLTLAVAGFAMLMSLLTISAMRLPQLAPVWALGLTRAELGRLELLRVLMLAALTGLCAVPLGLTLAWALLTIINVEAFGWRLPMYVFPGGYLWLIFQSLGAAALAAAWPAWRLARMPPAHLLRVFAYER